MLSQKAKKTNQFIYFLSATNYQLLMSATEEKPQVILDYNVTKKGVDATDKMFRTY